MADGRPAQKTNLLHASDYQIVTRYQGVFRGLVEYYAMAHNASKRLNRLRWVLETSLVHTLAGKHRCSAVSLWRKHKVKVEVRPWDWTNWGPPLWYGDSPGLATANWLNSCPRGCIPCAIGNGSRSNLSGAYVCRGV